MSMSQIGTQKLFKCLTKKKVLQLREHTGRFVCEYFRVFSASDYIQILSGLYCLWIEKKKKNIKIGPLRY